MRRSCIRRFMSWMAAAMIGLPWNRRRKLRNGRLYGIGFVARRKRIVRIECCSSREFEVVSRRKYAKSREQTQAIWGHAGLVKRDACLFAPHGALRSAKQHERSGVQRYAVCGGVLLQNK